MRLSLGSQGSVESGMIFRGQKCRKSGQKFYKKFPKKFSKNFPKIFQKFFKKCPEIFQKTTKISPVEVKCVRAWAARGPVESGIIFRVKTEMVILVRGAAAIMDYGNQFQTKSVDLIEVDLFD